MSNGRPLVAVINDDPAFLDLLSAFLTEDCHWNVVVWADGIDAIEKLKRHRPVAVILDIRLEDRNAGAAILCEMRRDTELIKMPVIVCTADSQFLRQNAGLISELGAEVLEKPFDLDELESKLNAILSSRIEDEAADTLTG